MLTWLWDALFTRRVWVEVDRVYYNRLSPYSESGAVYVLRDQWGNIKRRKVVHG